ncbi:cytochrome b561 [Nothoprocta perdicaria]|nr:cytochrome b561 [Nothoprocta perdicaria]
MEGAASPPAGPRVLSAAVALSQVLGLAALAATGAWLGGYRGGLAWAGALRLNVHPLCMVLAMVFLQGDALLAFRVFRTEPKRSAKALHALLHGAALLVAIVGVAAVFEAHSAGGVAHAYSLHAWCGLAVLVLFTLQWLLGLGLFVFPGAGWALRGRYRPLHVFGGVALLALSVATSLLGITEMLLFHIRDTYSKFPAEGVLANTLGLLLVAFGLLVGYIVTREDWRRPPLPEELALSMDFKTLTEAESPGGSQ